MHLRPRPLCRCQPLPLPPRAAAGPPSPRTHSPRRSCPSLEELLVGNICLTASLPPGALPRLTRLSFGGMFLNRGLGLLLPLPALARLEVAGLDAVTDAVVALVVARQGSLEVGGGARHCGLCRRGGGACRRAQQAAARLAGGGAGLARR